MVAQELAVTRRLATEKPRDVLSDPSSLALPIEPLQIK